MNGRMVRPRIKDVSWKIAAKSASDATVTLSETEYTYDGNAKEPSATVVLDGKTLVAGTDYDITYTDNTNAGTATATITFKGNYSGTANKTFTIKKAQVTVPTAAEGLVYTGSEQTGVTSRESTYTVSDGTGTNAGKYTATASLKDTDNYEWTDSTTKDKEISWSIAKANPTISLTPSSDEVTYPDGSEFTITTDSDGTLSAKSSDEKVAKVSLSDKKGTVTTVDEGSATGHSDSGRK